MGLCCITCSVTHAAERCTILLWQQQPLGLHLPCSMQVPHLSASIGTHEVHSCDMLVFWAHALYRGHLSV